MTLKNTILEKEKKKKTPQNIVSEIKNFKNREPLFE